MFFRATSPSGMRLRQNLALPDQHFGNSPTPEFVPFGDALTGICVGHSSLAGRYGIEHIPRLVWENSMVKRGPPGSSRKVQSQAAASISTTSSALAGSDDRSRLTSSRLCSRCCQQRLQRMEPLWTPVVATGGKPWQITWPPKWRNQAKTVAVSCDQLPRAAHGKEGVIGHWTEPPMCSGEKRFGYSRLGLVARVGQKFLPAPARTKKKATRLQGFLSSGGGI